jgi:hypothetical protein
MMIKLRRFRTVGPLLFIAATALLATPAFAVEVSYTTTGVFTCSGVGYVCSGNTLTGPNGLNILFTGIAEQFPNADVPPASFAPFGTFTVTGMQTRGANDLLNASFTLQVTQELPLPGGTENLGGPIENVTGQIRAGNSGVTVVFDHGTGTSAAGGAPDPIDGQPGIGFSFGGVSYIVDALTPLHPDFCATQDCSVTNPGISIINGAIDAVPEPTFYALTGIGFVGLFCMAMYRRRQKESLENVENLES